MVIPLPQLVQRFDIYLPLRYNDGMMIPEEHYRQVEFELVERFSGVTMIEQRNPLKGVWKFQNRHYVDEIIIVTTLDFHYSSEGHQSEPFFIDYKEKLKQRFEQLDILIIAQTVTVI